MGLIKHYRPRLYLELILEMYNARVIEEAAS